MQYIRKDKQFDAEPSQKPQIAIFSPTCPGTILITWTIIRDGISFPNLEVTDDAWAMLASMPNFIQCLGKLDDMNAPVEVLEFMLKHDLGYEDITQRTAEKAVA